MATSDHPWRPRVFDFLLAGVVLLFAFLATSFAVRNSDFWLHLAGGRLLAEGRYQFGVDPFAYTTTGVYWANCAWLFDLLLFLLYQQFGGTTLVILKALLITALAAILLRVRRPGSRSGLPALCTLLAVLAISPRLLLHSTCLSYVLLGVAFWLLWRPCSKPSSPRQDLKHYSPLLLLFVLWVNVDGWFLLGPLLAALFWLGERIVPIRSANNGVARTPAWLWLAGLAVCLLNPHHLHAFTLPMDLMPLPVELRHDGRYNRLFASPWRLSLLVHPSNGLNLATGAYLSLLILGLLSFLLNVRHLVGWRLLVWLSFAGLSAWLARAIPFFAVIAGPITALNLQDFLSRRSETRGWRWGRVTVFASGLAMSFLAWPGWLQGFGDAGRHVDWTVQPDGSLQRVAQTLQRWHREGKLRDGRGFLFHPSVVHYCAWFCPEEKGFLDHRFPLFRAVAGEYEQVCRALNPPRDAEPGKPSGDWRSILRAHDITHLVLYDPDLQRLMPGLQRLALEEQNWTLLDIDGQALIVGWKDQGHMVPAGIPPFDADRLAFRESEGGGWRVESGGNNSPSTLHPPPSTRRPSSSWQSDAAGVLLRYFEECAPRRFQERALRCIRWAAALPALPALSAGALDGALRLLLQMEQAPFAPGDPSQQPPALPLLAVRAARCALAENPDDAAAYLRLGRAYLFLANRTPERTVLHSFQPLAHLRHIQIAVALENALRRKPELTPVHDDLANLYEERNFLDAALDHRREALRLTRRVGPVGDETAEAFASRLTRRETATRALEHRVGDLKNEFALRVSSIGSEPYRKARFALRMGLARLALDDILMPAQMVLLGGEGIRLQVDLQLQLGRIEPAREHLNSEDWRANKQNLGFMDLSTMRGTGPAQPDRFPAYDWLLLCQAAAIGDYEQADAALHALLEGMGGQRIPKALRTLGHQVSRTLALEVALSSSQPSWMARFLTRNERARLTALLAGASLAMAKQADLHVLAGMLALERGSPRRAEDAFRTAVEQSRLRSAAILPNSGQLLAEAYLRILSMSRR